MLARELLLERAKTPLPRAPDRISGIQAQYAPSMYIGLWSRVVEFERVRSELNDEAERLAAFHA